MRELKFIKETQLGKIIVNLRIIKNLLYFKYNETQYAKQVISQFKAKGVKIREGKNWIEVDLFGDNKEAKIGEYLIDLETDSQEKIEKNLEDFYLTQYIKSGFKLV